VQARDLCGNLRARVVLRPTLPDDLPHVIGEPLPCRIKAVTGEIDGRVIGVGGLAFLPGGTVVAWAALTDEARKAKVSLHKAGLRMMRDARAAGFKRVVASADAQSPTAVRWLKRLGFELIDDDPATEDGHPIFVWRG